MSYMAAAIGTGYSCPLMEQRTVQARQECKRLSHFHVKALLLLLVQSISQPIDSVPAHE